MMAQMEPGTDIPILEVSEHFSMVRKSSSRTFGALSVVSGVSSVQP